MKVIFVGPSLPGARSLVGDEIDVRPPATCGDVFEAVSCGAKAIGIVDGGFEYTAPVWHKEILFALFSGVRVFGGASMGALRAAECKPFGMIGIGRVYDEYASGRTIDDADVALLHGPPELGYTALTVPMVNVRATLDELEGRQELTRDLRMEVETVAADLFFKVRTWKSIVEHLNCPVAGKKALLRLLKSREVDQKRADALALICAVRMLDITDSLGDPNWEFNETFPLSPRR